MLNVKGVLYFTGGYTGQVQFGSYILSSTNYNLYLLKVNSLGSVLETPQYFIDGSESDITEFLHLGNTFYWDLYFAGNPYVETLDVLTGNGATFNLPQSNVGLLIADTIHGYLYTDLLRKYDLSGTEITKMNNGTNKPNLLLGQQNGNCYLLKPGGGNLSVLGNTVYNPPLSTSLIINYDMNTETVLGQTSIANIGCTFSNPVVLGNKRFVFATNGIIKVNGTVYNNGLVLIKF
jgi:hypothetical protein